MHFNNYIDLDIRRYAKFEKQDNGFSNIMFQPNFLSYSV